MEDPSPELLKVRHHLRELLTVYNRTPAAERPQKLKEVLERLRREQVQEK